MEIRWQRANEVTAIYTLTIRVLVQPYQLSDTDFARELV